MYKKALKAKITEEITKLLEETLNYTQVAVEEAHWKALRSKVLRSHNNCMRNLQAWIDKEE